MKFVGIGLLVGLTLFGCGVWMGVIAHFIIKYW
jgi:hypothetical protein